MQNRWIGLPGVLLALLTGCQAQLDTAAAAKRIPMQTQTLGQSVEGRPIVLHRFGAGPVRTLIIGGVHGDETNALALTESFVTLLQSSGDVEMSGAVAIIPVANPDGAALGRRTNSRKIDVNRNFPASNWGKSRKGVYHGGPAALSEPETRAIKDAVDSLKPKQIVSVHSITRGRECNNFDGPGEPLAQRMAVHNGYPVRATIGYPTPGSFGSWAGADLKIAVVTLELPRDLPAVRAWETNRGALLAAIRE